MSSDANDIHDKRDIEPSVQVDWYRAMLEIRHFEDKVHELFQVGDIQGPMHLCQGQEAVSVGAIAAIRPDDYVTITYRGHGQALAKGIPISAAFGEIMGRTSGCCAGVGGSMHLTDLGRGVLGSFAIVGAGLPVAVGAAMSASLQGRDQVALSFCGDGATNIGTFHEAVNMASAWSAPVVFICENNLYGEYSPIWQTTPVEDLAERAKGYGIPGHIVDGQDVFAVYSIVADAVELARRGGGPTLIEAKTYRYRGHARLDPGHYRPKGELERWLERDPIQILESALIADGILTADAASALRAEVKAAVDTSAQGALLERYSTVEEVASYVYGT